MSSMDDCYDAEMIGRLTAAACENAELKAERNRLRKALESHVRGLDKMRHLISEGRGASGKLEDIRTAIIYERVAATAALQEDRDDTRR